VPRRWLPRGQSKRLARHCAADNHSKRHSASSDYSGVATDTVPPVTVTAVAAAPILSGDPPLSTCQYQQPPAVIVGVTPQMVKNRTLHSTIVCAPAPGALAPTPA